MFKSNIPLKRSTQLPKKNAIPVSNNTVMERKKKDNKVNQYAIITASSLQEQKQLYEDVSNMKKEYDTEIEQITMENQTIKEIFINFSAKWIQNLESTINITNSTLSDRTQLLSDEIAQFESKFNDLFEKYVILQRDNQDLKDQILNEQNQLQDKSNEFDRLKLQFESYRIQSQNENQEILSRQLNNQQVEDENKALQDQISQISHDYQLVQDQYQILNDSYRSLQKEIEDKDELISNLNSQIKSNEHFATVAEMSQQNLINENRVLKEKLEMSNQMAEILKKSPTKSSELQEKEEEIDNLRQSINLKDLEIEQLKSQVYELGNQNDHDQIALKDQEIESLNQRIEELVNKLNKGDSFQEFIDSLSQIADDTEQSKVLKEQLNQKDEMIKTMKNQIQLKDQELSDFQRISAELTEKTSLLNDLQQSVVEMRAEIKAKNSSIDEFKKSFKDKEQTIANLTSRLDEKDQLIDNLESQALDINKEKENSDFENIEMKKKIDSMSETLKFLQAKINELESSSSNEKANFNEEIILLKDKCRLLDLQNEEKQSLINEKDEQIKEFTSRQSFYQLKMKEGDQLALENDNLKTSLDEHKKQLEATQSENEELKKNLKLIDDEKDKIKLDLTQIEYDRNKLLEKVEEFEAKFDKNLEDENNQLSQYVKELEVQILDLNTKSQKSISFEKQIKQYDDELKDLKMMLDTYKKINEMLQEKLDQSNKQNSELASKISNDPSQINKAPSTPLQKTTIACSPFKFDQDSAFGTNQGFVSDSNVQEILAENENLKKEIEQWKKASSLLKNNLQIAENDRNFYQSECGRLNSALETNEYDQKINAKLCKDYENEISQLKANCEKLRDENKKIIEENKETIETFHKTSSELTSTKCSYKELNDRYKNFTHQLSNILHKETEQEIIFNVIQLINSFSCLKANNSSQSLSKIQYFSVSHTNEIESFANEIQQKLESANCQLSRLEKKIELASRKINLQINQSKISVEAIGHRRMPATERKKPLLDLYSKNLIPNITPQKSSTRGNLHFVKRDSPSNFGNISPTLKELVFS